MEADSWTHVGGHRLRDVPRSRPEWVWPAAEWADHLESCPRGKRCDHRLQLPDWWAAVMTSSTRSREHEDAIRRKIVAVGRYQPSVPLSESGLRFARETVMNALALAPDPLSESWARMTLASVSGLVAFCESYGVPLAPEAVFDEATVDRYLTSRTDVSDNTRYQIKGRLLRLKRFMVPVSAPAYASDTGRGDTYYPLWIEAKYGDVYDH